MATTNPITGDLIKSKPSQSYADNYDAIFRKDEKIDLMNMHLSEQEKTIDRDFFNYLLHDPIDGFN